MLYFMVLCVYVAVEKLSANRYNVATPAMDHQMVSLFIFSAVLTAPYVLSRKLILKSII